MNIYLTTTSYECIEINIPMENNVSLELDMRNLQLKV